ncbi:uncharacterized protein NECHADRAFT_75826 [Fusarium vanettenii 77-13-4]|uniref:Uncharacterized protein n=1 Tax=Fusarium vanettenii (strain ATCC MYA-4622 / CBS 123669 / FGSC 9596 / NRRL 45880 / 77-13-4) TaxID=660122 RepID=C7Z5P7_FUSV7|nr:uncharacterized protein NECHADRAFT_75826 [Fusarium vanettenii 77-13-4]EEU39986.1 hypothetical protein NECHADRAFT_75826 [Fusarium vanettenii 77-13-4]
MFSSSPPKGPSGQRSTVRNLQPATPSRSGANVSQPNHSEPTMSTATQLTPSRATQLAQAGSPNTPFGISSDSESSGSDFCEIQHVQPSPNRKRNLPAADQRVQPSKKAKTKQAPPETCASVNNTKPTPQASSGPSRAPPQPASSAAASTRSSSVSSKAKPAVKAKLLPQPDNSSDCFIEKVLPSPKRRQETQPQSSKRRRIDRAGNASALVGERNGQDSECEIVHIKPSPNRLSLTMLTSTDSDADDERPAGVGPRVPRKIATPRKGRALPLKPADNRPAMKEPAATPSPVPSRVDQSIVIDLSQLITSDSDSSVVETSHSTAQVTQPRSAQGEPTAQSNHGTATEVAPSPENSQSQHQSDPESDDITGKLMDYLDSQLEAMKKEKEASPSSGEEPLSTAPEHLSKVEPQEDSRAIKKEIGSGAEGSDDDHDDDEGGDDHIDDHDDEDSPTLVKMEDAADSDSSGPFMSSPPVSYQLPPTEEDSPKPVKREPETEAEDESDTGDFNDETLNTSVSSFNERLATSYKLQPVYSGDRLSETNEPGTPGSFQPHHRDSLIGLKSILKRSQTSPARASGDNPEYSSSPSVSPPSRSRRNEPRTGPTRHRKSPASKLATVASAIKKQLPSKAFIRVRSWLPPRPNVTKRAKTPSPKRPRGWRLQKKQLTPLVPIPPASLERDSDGSTSSQETPSKPPAKRPAAAVQQPTQAVTHHETSNVGASEDARKISEKTQNKAAKKKQLKPITHSSLVKPPREIKPAIIRDGVSEHAIKPTVARFEKKMAEGKGFTYNKTDSSNTKYNWEVDWGTPLPHTERTSRALAAELEERGIKTDRQYANFWYNLTMKYSKLAGSPVPLFTAKKKALEDVVEEALQNEKRRKRKARKAEKKKQQQEKKKQPQGIEALLLSGADEADEAGEESNSDESVDMEALIAKMKADEQKQRMLTGVGTSCGYLKK